MLRLYDTATREVRELATREPGVVDIYLCGPTVYGPPHIGHGRATMEYDVLARYLRWRGLQVRLVSNVTDIDDAIINRANREQRPWDEIAQKCERVWFKAMDGINVARPDDIPHATQYVDEMVAMIGELVDLGKAYLTEDGVYLSVETVPDYGLLAHQDLDQLVAGGGDRAVVGAEHKRHPADFVLWKLAKPGEPSWPSPWGEGRPGWHSECVVMSLDLLGEGFDLHCGGMDLRFPHHENERAQAVALGKRFANHWMHHGFIVDAEGEKMSKSLGNVDNLLDLIEQYDPRAYRLLLLQSHYRSPITITDENLRAAEQTLAGPGRVRRPERGGAHGRPPIRRCSTPSGRRWTRTSTLRRRWPWSSTPCAAPTRRSTAATRRPVALVDAVREMTDAVGLELTWSAVVPDEVRGAGGRPRCGSRREGLRPGRRHPGGAARRWLDRRDDPGGHGDSSLNRKVTRGRHSRLPTGNLES